MEEDKLTVQTGQSHRTCEAIAQTGLGNVALISEEWPDEFERVGVDFRHHVQLALMPYPKNPVGRFSDRWRPGRFSRIGQLFLFPADEPIQARSDLRVQRSVMCDLDPKAMSEWFDMDFAWTDNRLEGSLDITSRPTRQLLVRLGQELRDPGFGGGAMIELIVAQIGLELSRYFRGRNDGQMSGGLAPWRMRRIDDYLRAEAGKASLSEIAALSDLSIRHLARSFRISTGRSLGDYIASHRMARAQTLLGSGLSVKEVAFATGFSAPSNFAAAFRRATGKTPREYQRTIPAERSAVDTVAIE